MRVSFRHQVLALAAIGGSIALVVAGWLSWNLARPLPADAILLRRFHDHRSELDSLAATALADTQLVGAGHDPMLMRFAVFIRDTPQSNRLLTNAEVRATGRIELRHLLDRVGLPSIARSREGNTVWFVVMSSGGARKGLVYSVKPLEPLRSSLDGVEREADGYVRSGYVSLAPRWFLFLEPSD